MLEVNYKKDYSFRNKHSSINRVVIDRLKILRDKAKGNNELRVNIYKQVAMDFPYKLELTQNDINENDAIIKLNLCVNVRKLFVLCIVTSIIIGLILGYLIHSYLVIIPLILNVLVFYFIVRRRVYNFTQEVVDEWFK